MTTHIKYDDTLSWCGKPLDNNFHFSSVEAAVLNGAHNTNDKTPRACRLCTNVIITYLNEGVE